jgi:peptidoglycan/LPS O-acetylase OafA/YrhL
LLGEASFAIYLFQALGFELVSAFVTGAHPLVLALLSTLGATTVGVLVHRFIEKPLTTLLKRSEQGPRRLPKWMWPLPAMVEN